jgi:hypothetical protein
LAAAHSTEDDVTHDVVPQIEFPILPDADASTGPKLKPERVSVLLPEPGAFAACDALTTGESYENTSIVVPSAELIVITARTGFP